MQDWFLLYSFIWETESTQTVEYRAELGYQISTIALYVSVLSCNSGYRFCWTADLWSCSFPL